MARQMLSRVQLDLLQGNARLGPSGEIPPAATEATTIAECPGSQYRPDSIHPASTTLVRSGLDGTDRFSLRSTRWSAQLIGKFRSTLVANAHHLTLLQAQAYADLEVARLTRQHANDEIALLAAPDRQLKPWLIPERPAHGTLDDSAFPPDGGS